jgi:hypothetical protein
VLAEFAEDLRLVEERTGPVILRGGCGAEL